MFSKQLKEKLDKYHLLNHYFYKAWNEGRFDDTNKMFVKPKKFDFQVTSKEAEQWANKIAEQLISKKRN